ncbi:hypothetical protein M885DRAFT_586505 [Pelagophyceae sp. CCMP2097]|nr:hypothetical protein M885DRAFT_586505 [Pelagophyceae sp. CCMP2097]
MLSFCDGDGGQNPQGLVHRFVSEAMLAANVTLQPWIKKYAMAYFDDDAADVDCKGETLQQYNCYKHWVKELDAQLSKFVRDEGFSSPEQCYAAIERLVKEDKEAQQAAVAQLLAKLRESSDFVSMCEAAGDGGDAEPLICFMFLPVPVEELVCMVLQLGEYETFAMMMRAHAKQIRHEREARKRMRGFLMNRPANEASAAIEARAEPKDVSAQQSGGGSKEAPERKSGDAKAESKGLSVLGDGSIKLTPPTPENRRRVEVKATRNSPADDRVVGDDDDDDVDLSQATRNKVHISRPGQPWAP